MGANKELTIGWTHVVKNNGNSTYTILNIIQSLSRKCINFKLELLGKYCADPKNLDVKTFPFNSSYREHRSYNERNSHLSRLLSFLKGVYSILYSLE